MGKKSSITTTKGTNGDAVANAPANGTNALTIEAAIAKRKRAAKTPPPKPAPAKVVLPKPKAVVAEKPAFTQEQIALRAYFIAENRHAHGLAGDAHQDWLEAERQIMAESRRARAGGKSSRSEIS